MGWARQARFNEASQAGTDATLQHAVLYAARLAPATCSW